MGFEVRGEAEEAEVEVVEEAKAGLEKEVEVVSEKVVEVGSVRVVEKGSEKEGKVVLGREALVESDERSKVVFVKGGALSLVPSVLLAPSVYELLTEAPSSKGSTAPLLPLVVFMLSIAVDSSVRVRTGWRICEAWTWTGSQPPGACLTFEASIPSKRGMEGPVRSTSRIPTEWPARERERAS